MSGDIWIVLIEDRQVGVEALPFSSEDAAVTAAWTAARDNARVPGAVAGDTTLTPLMRNDGWILYLPYGPEGDSVRVVKREMDRGGQ